MVFDEISEWLDDVLEDISDTGIPNAVIAFGFNLYDNGDEIIHSNGAKKLNGMKY